MIRTFKALSALLSYPTKEIKSAAEDIRSVIIEEALVPKQVLDQLNNLIDDLGSLDLYELQERYVLLFDRTRSLCLHLFEHVHGESRDRGQAMVDLKELYAQGGLEIDANELPDFLPLFLEYLSTRPQDEARALLAEPLSIIVALKERLDKRDTPYGAVFYALEAIAQCTPIAKEIVELRKTPDDDPNDLEALDAVWEEVPVTFGPGEENCPKVSEMLDRMQAPTPPSDISKVEEVRS